MDNANASAWGNGYKTIPKEIQAAVGKNEMLTKIITYFDSLVVPVLSDAIADEMYDAMKELVENCDLRDSKKQQLMKYYADCKYGEFLGRVFQRALLGNNKVSSPQRKKSASDAKSESIDEWMGYNKLDRFFKGIYNKTKRKEVMDYVRKNSTSSKTYIHPRIQTVTC